MNSTGRRGAATPRRWSLPVIAMRSSGRQAVAGSTAIHETVGRHGQPVMT
jgi:hypothetical protein